MPDAGCPMRDARCGMPDAECPMPNRKMRFNQLSQASGIRHGAFSGPVLRLALLAATAASGAETIPIRGSLAPGPYYVGQAIDLTVATIGARTRPRVEAPKVAGAVVTPTGTESR